MLVGTSISAQAQKKAGIYWVNFEVAEELRVNKKVNDDSRNWFSGFSDEIIIPDEILDSIKTYTEKKLTKKLRTSTKCVYRLSKKGDPYMTSDMGMGNSLANMPTSSLKKSLKNNKSLKYYIKVTGGITATKAALNPNKVKPILNLKVVVTDRKGDTYWKNKITLKDFDKRKSSTSKRGSITVSKNDPLTADEVLTMYCMGMDAVIMGGKKK